MKLATYIIYHGDPLTFVEQLAARFILHVAASAVTFLRGKYSSPDLSSSSLLSPPPHRPNPHLSTVSYFPSSFLSSFRLLPRNPLRCLRLCNQSRLSSTYRHPSSTTTINDHRISLRILIGVGSLSCFHHSRWYSLSRAVNLK